MSVVHEAPPVPVEVRDRRPWFQLPEVWGALAIAVMWLAVLFVGVFGGDMRFAANDGSGSTIPAVIAVAFFAAPATASVAKRAFRR